MRTRPASLDPCVEVMLPPSEIAVSISRSIVRRLVVFDDGESAYLVALTEIVSNAIDEHARSGIDSPISMAVRLAADAGVVVTNCARGADESGDSLPHGETAAGRGLVLARAFVPGLDVESSSNGWTVTLPLAGFGTFR